MMGKDDRVRVMCEVQSHWMVMKCSIFSIVKTHLNSLGISLGFGRSVATVYDCLKPREIPKEFNNPTMGTLLELGE